MTTKKKIPLRLAMRAEGLWWNAYIAKPDTMEGAEQIGSILLGAVNKPERKAAFLDLMKAIMSDGIENISGKVPSWEEPKGAPENERSGNA